MKTIRLLPIALIAAALPAAAEPFAQIRDADGYAYIRATPDTKGRIVAKMPSGGYVYAPEGDGGDFRSGQWQTVYYSDTKGYIKEGWMHGSRLNNIGSHRKIPVKITADGFSCMHNGIGLTVKVGKFDYRAHRRDFRDRKGAVPAAAAEFPSIDVYRGKTVFGTDGQMPTTHYRSITFTRKGQTVAVAPAAFEHLFNPYFDSLSELRHGNACYYRADDETFFLSAQNSDGAAVYNVLFVFEKGRLKKVLPMLHPEA
ncbi:SH3 domain-containing protein [Neisseria sp.]|uniref:SH3 domain-containing protein n=1 Tax=Neisseria sp. TaxID=192066 RepID=UPI00359F9710